MTKLQESVQEIILALGPVVEGETGVQWEDRTKLLGLCFLNVTCMDFSSSPPRYPLGLGMLENR